MWQEPIFDRTNADTLTARAGQSNIDNHKGALNYQDLNRIEGNFQFVVDKLFENSMVIPHTRRSRAAGVSTNLVHNGSFENGTAEWVQAGTGVPITISNNEKYEGAASAYLKMNDNMSSTWIEQLIQPVYGRIYYYSLYVKKVTQNNASVMTEWKYSKEDWTTYWVTMYSTDVGNGWQRCSGIFNTRDIDEDYIRCTLTFGLWLDSSDVSGSIEAYFDNAMMVDLTETFGPGNEPSREWCDENITYFEGTQPLKYTDWQEQNIPWLSEIDRIRSNYNNLVTLFLHSLGLPVLTSSQYLMYDEVNDWERIAFVGKQMFENMEKEYIRCGTTNCGGDTPL